MVVLTQAKINGIVAEVAGEAAVPIIEYLKDKKNISEFIIADHCKFNMQQTRNILYRLNGYHIATYVRRKDRKKGWYISYWTFNRSRVREIIDLRKRQKLEMLQERLAREQENLNSFFICSSACSRLDFEQATENDFKCPECGMLMNQQENARTIEHLKEQIATLEKTKA